MLWHLDRRRDPVPFPDIAVWWTVAFSPDSTRLVSGGNDATVRRWTLSRPGESLVCRGFRASIESVAITPDGQFATAHDDTTVRLWRCPVCGPLTDVLAYADHHVTRSLTPEERATYLTGST